MEQRFEASAVRLRLHRRAARELIKLDGCTEETSQRNHEVDFRKAFVGTDCFEAMLL